MRWVAGLDGGGTKTLAVLMDETGTIVSESRSGPSNPFRIGAAGAVAAVREGVELAAAHANIDAGCVAVICAGLAGTGNSELAEQVRALLAADFPQSIIHLCTDLDLALAAAGAGDNAPVMVLVAGTGSAAIGRDKNGRVLRVGGHGPQAGDEGSAYHIGRRALQSINPENVSTAKMSAALSERILAELGASSWAEAQKLAQAIPEEVYAKLFPTVATLADAGDELAQTILLEAAQQLSRLVATLGEQLSLADQQFLLAKTGGMLRRSSFFDAQLNERLQSAAPKARMSQLVTTPAEAAARMALALLPIQGPIEK